jgi:hypothetical protein
LYAVTSPAAGLYYKGGCDVSIEQSLSAPGSDHYPALSQHAALSEALEGTRDVPMNANQYVVGILRRELVNTGTDSPVCEGC